MRNTFRFFAAIAVCSLVSTAVDADVINIDFGTEALLVGTAAAPDAGTTWTQFDGGEQTGAALVDSFGIATGVTLTKSASPQFGTEGGGSPTTNALMVDYLHDANTGDLEDVTFSGLIANGAYDLYLYGHGDQPAQHTEFTVAAANGGAVGLANGDDRDPIAVGVNFTVLSANADSAGNLSYQWGRPVGGGASHSAHNGVQLVSAAAIPEPSSLALIGLGAIGMLVRRKR